MDRNSNILFPGTETSQTILQDGETPYNVAGKNMKIRKLITQLLEASLDDSDEENEKGHDEDAEGDVDEWEEADGDGQGEKV